jgi:hypothetical protein
MAPLRHFGASFIDGDSGFLNERTVRKIVGTGRSLGRLCWGGIMEMTMKKLFVPVMAAAVALCFSASGNAATGHKTVSAELQASCKAQAAKKFSAIHFIKRRNFANDCLAKHAGAAKPKATVASKPAPATTAAKPMPSTTGQSTK